MLNRIIEFSLRHRFLVILAVAALAALGGLSLRRLDIDAFPDTTPVQVQINTVAPASVLRKWNKESHLPSSRRSADCPA